MSSGIYVIRNKINGNIYIGSTSNFSKRRSRHFRYLQKNCHENRHLQNAFNKYGELSFEFIVVKRTKNLLEEEQKLLNDHFGKPNCYNICGTAGSPSVVGRVKTLEWRKKIAQSLKQFYQNNPSHSKKLSEMKKGKKLSTEIRQKMSDAHKKGSQHHNSKLTEEQVMSIKSKYSPRMYSYGKLAKEYSVDRKTIIRIIQGKTWSQIKLSNGK
jgi:group I intron endonuclease